MSWPRNLFSSPQIALLVVTLTACSPRMEVNGPERRDQENAYAAHPNPAQAASGNLGATVGSVVSVPAAIIAFPLCVYSHPNVPIFDSTPVINGCSQITGAVTWPLFGWRYLEPSNPAPPLRSQP